MKKTLYMALLVATSSYSQTINCHFPNVPSSGDTSFYCGFADGNGDSAGFWVASFDGGTSWTFSAGQYSPPTTGALIDLTPGPDITLPFTLSLDSTLTLSGTAIDTAPLNSLSPYITGTTQLDLTFDANYQLVSSVWSPTNVPEPSTNSFFF